MHQTKQGSQRGALEELGEERTTGGVVERVPLVQSDYNVLRVGFQQQLRVTDSSQATIWAAKAKLQAVLIENLHDRLVVPKQAHVGGELDQDRRARDRPVTRARLGKRDEPASEHAISYSCW